MTGATIAVVGAGFSGSLLTLHLLRRCSADTRIVLIERTRRFGCGTAYSTPNPAHLLNVPAGRMSAFDDRPNDLLEWLRQSPLARRTLGEANPELHAGSFIPRRVYGEYVRARLKGEMRRDPRKRVTLINAEVLAMSETGTGLRLTLDWDRTLAADYVVLATGNPPPESLRVADASFYNSAFYKPDPWARDALAGLDAKADVLLIGTGLTSVDTVLSLLERGHTGAIHAISRRGLVPRPHQAQPASGDAMPPQSLPTSCIALLREIRAGIRASEAAGGSWHGVIDGLRPVTQDLWQAMPQAERRRFLRHLRPWWDVHRHRMAPQVAGRIEAARQSGQLRIGAGRIRDYRIIGDTVTVTYRAKRAVEFTTIEVGRVINCSGPGADFQRITQPLMRGLLARGLVRPDPLHLGLDTAASGALIRRDGSLSRRLFAIGPLTKGAFWEITAVPDIRRQCELMAHHLARLAAHPSRAAVVPLRTSPPKWALAHAI